MNEVALSVLFDTSTDIVWAAWTQPQMLAHWFGSDPAGVVTSAIMDVQPGGFYSITFCDSDGTEHNCMGEYQKVHEPLELTFSWEWKSEPGQISRVSILLLPCNGKTLMKFNHSDLGTNSAHHYEEGWKRTFEKLKLTLSKSR